MKNLKTSHLIAFAIFVIILLVIAFAKASPKTEDFCYQTAMEFQKQIENVLNEELKTRGNPFKIDVTMKVDQCDRENNKAVVTYTTKIETSFDAEQEDGGVKNMKVCATSIDEITFTKGEEGKIEVSHKPISEVVSECAK